MLQYLVECKRRQDPAIAVVRMLDFRDCTRIPEGKACEPINKIRIKNQRVALRFQVLKGCDARPR